MLIGKSGISLFCPKENLTVFTVSLLVTMSSSDEYLAFDEISKTGFHINSVVALFGLIMSIFMFIHVLYEWKYKIYCVKKTISKQTKKNLNLSVINCAIIVMFLSMFIFIVYCIEFFFLRIFPPKTFNYSSWNFCKNLTPFLFISIAFGAFAIIHYFLLRLKHSFKSSILSYPNYIYIILRLITIPCVIIPSVLGLIATVGVPYNVETSEITNNNPWLCRNAIYNDWPTFWTLVNIFGIITSLGGNFLCWFLFMNRLGKFVELGLKSDDQFLRFYTQKRRQKIKIKKNKKNKYLYKDVEIQSITDDNKDNNKDNNDRASSVDVHSVNVIKEPNHQRAASRSVSINEIVNKAKLKYQIKEENRLQRKNQRNRKELKLYSLIKKQSLLTGIVSISGAVFWTIQIIYDEGSTLILLDIIINVICVYLSFAFKKKCFQCCCESIMSECTCIEDRIEKKLAKKLGLGNKTGSLSSINDEDDIHVNDIEETEEEHNDDDDDNNNNDQYQE